MILLLVGMCLQAGLTLITIKLIVIGAFLFITGPTATHAVANAALMSGLLPKAAKGLKAAQVVPLLGGEKQGEGVAVKVATKPKAKSKAAKAKTKAKTAAKPKAKAAKAKPKAKN
jgi:multicomponent Na+:H+ antiporter subunit G